jgi:hypothetical protein
MTTIHLDQTQTSSPRTAPPGRRLGATALITGGVTQLVGFVVVPGPGVADVHSRAWVPGHLLLVVGFLLLALGLPAIGSSLGSRLGVAGWIGYAAVMTRCVLTTGSHLYYASVLPTLAAHPDLHRQLTSDGKLASIYGGHGDYVSAVLGASMLGLAYALARCGRGLRVIAAMVALASVAEFIGTPFGLVLLGITGIWLGARLVRSGDVFTPLRTTR